ncbi:hypothetical protein HAX54_017996 [Datura stramonium]|uniref:Uncharacterized protein n=1 Tax=Datura stramonium TaxID=4076 RepID=A0ABS8S136_DATST|nr:hypothetical protein [Datura stramonium]
MACIHHIYVFTFLLAVIVCHQVLFTEGRQLKALKKDKFDSTRENENHFQFTSSVSGNELISSTRKRENSPVSVKLRDINQPKQVEQFSTVSTTRPVEGSLDDLKDHSPGIGHSVQKENIGTNV